MATLEHFLKTGQLGALAPGMRKSEVERALGAPADYSVRANPQIWKYGALQLALSRLPDVPEPIVSFLGLYFRNAGDELPHRLGLAGWWPAPGTTRREFEQRLAEQGVALPTDAEHEPDHILFPSAVRVAFDADKLDSMQLSFRLKPESKQLSLSLPNDVWDRVSEEAKRRRVSPAKLCSELITRELGNGAPVES